ncbi:MAG: AAA family ATPase [Clostridia bacterium]|nr:AAA family ATPase [Clostridia bacterium]
MASYRFELTDYHAVRKASIALDGVTVLSGLNGSGKSTIARWLQHTIYTLAHYDRLVEKEGIQTLEPQLFDLISMVSSLVGYQKSIAMRRSYDRIKSRRFETLEQIEGDYRDICGTALNLIEDHLYESENKEDIERVANYFGVYLTKGTEAEVIDNLLHSLTTLLDARFAKVMETVVAKKETRNDKNFSDKIFSIADETIEDDTIQIQLWEDGVELLNPNEFKIPLMLNRVIYINTQELGNPFIRRSEQGTYRGLLKMLSDTSESPVSEASKSIAYLIKNLIGGDINVEKQDLGGKIERTEFKFVAKNGKSFNLKGAATGVISFSYILQLLQNGWLTDKTMLIIDEPESHLHPQWIVDYARILVLINKMIGTKILLSSHNPDMIAAIQTISESKGLKDITRFYLATPSPEAPDQNDFKDLGFNIEQIFDSFNIALSRIDSYNLPS